MTQLIPVTNYPDQTFRITLDEQIMDWRVYWSAFDDYTKSLVGDGIEGQWYADMATADGSINLNGVAIVVGADILEPHGYAQLGGLWVVDNDGQGRDLDFLSLGTSHSLIYVPAADKDAFNLSIGWTI